MGNTRHHGHARDADVIVGDNGNIFRLVGSGEGRRRVPELQLRQLLRGVQIVPRAAQLIDYTPGGPDKTVTSRPGAVAINPVTGLRDIGAGDGSTAIG